MADFDYLYKYYLPYICMEDAITYTGIMCMFGNDTQKISQDNYFTKRANEIRFQYDEIKPSTIRLINSKLNMVLINRNPNKKYPLQIYYDNCFEYILK